MEDKEHILVIYIGLKKIPEDMWNEYLERVKEIFSNELKNEKYTYLFIPSVERSDTEVVCVNPEYITNDDLIKQHEENMNMMNKELLELIKNEKFKKYDKK